MSKEGVVTGKRPGEVQIRVKCQGKQENLKLKVKAVKNKPELPVALDEVVLQGVKMKKNAKKGYVYSAMVRNRAKKETVKKIIYYYQVTVLAGCFCPEARSRDGWNWKFQPKWAGRESRRCPA